MKNRRLRYDTDCIRIQHKIAYLNIDEIVHIDYDKNTVLVHENEIHKLKMNKLDAKGKDYRIKDLKWLFKQKAFITVLDVDISMKQFRELKRCLHFINKGELVKLDNMAKFINSGIDTKFIERQRYILNVMRSNGSIGTIVRYGLHNLDKRTQGFKKGNKNPAFNHQGKLSSGSKNFLKYENLSEEEKQDKIDIVHKKIGSSNKFNGNNKRTISYHRKITNTEEEAKKSLAEAQTFFTIGGTIEELGEEMGLIKIKSIANKKRETFHTKSIEEQSKINISRGAGSLGYWASNKFHIRPELQSMPGIIYYFKCIVDDVDYWKIGITSKDFNTRWTPLKQKVYSISNIRTHEMTISECLDLEQLILQKFSSNRARNHLGTEFFDIDVLSMYKLSTLKESIKYEKI